MKRKLYLTIAVIFRETASKRKYLRTSVALTILLPILVFFPFSDSSAQTLPKTGTAINAFVPAHWEIMEQAKGDLNNDGIPDAALVLKDKAENQTGIDTENIPRLLVIIFGVQGGGYTLSAAKKDAILCKTCGGVFGDPFSGIKITRGTVVIDHYGGSRDRWGYTHRWRFQDGDWYLIGLASRTEDSAVGTSETTDTNLITGDRIVEKKPASGKAKVARSKVPVKPLRRLSSFTFGD